VALRDAIRSGRLAAGTRLPSSRALADDLELARTTVAEAYAQLEAEGYVIARRGAGTWVAELGCVPSPRRPAGVGTAPARRFSFNPGLPDLVAFPHNAWAKCLLEGLREHRASSLGYSDPRGLPELRAVLADYLARARGVVADPELVVVCAGFSHALSLLARVLRGRGLRCMAMEDPCLPSHREIVAGAGLDAVPLEVDGDGAQTSVLGSTDAGAVLLAPANQFPLGSVLAPRRRAAAIDWAGKHDGVVIEDDYDGELRYDRTPVGALQGLDPERVVFTGTVSKCLAPGVRLGWMVVPASLVDAIVRQRRTEGALVAATDQIAFARLLGSGGFERHIRRMRTRYRARREQLLAMLAERAPGATPVGISAGLRILLELPLSSPPAEAIAGEAAERSIELFPVGRCYHAGHAPEGRDGLVLGYAALPEHDFEPALEALGELLHTTLRRDGHSSSNGP
jgi:GntR family transcriptional regulator/MocR family aminotransferase